MRLQRKVPRLMRDGLAQNNLMQDFIQDNICRPPAGPIPGLLFALCIALFIALALALGGCSHDQGLNIMASGGRDDDEINVRPADYKPDILRAMHAYLNDPTGIRDAGISEPALKPFGASKRYVVCVRYTAKKARNEYFGAKEVAAVFVAGRFDRFAETAHDTANDQCAGMTYAAFPELEKLSR
jgi:hypothetical protein